MKGAVQEAAAVLGVSQATVYRTLSQAREEQ
jgi:predicted transcriptional regulator YheO